LLFSCLSSARPPEVRCMRKLLCWMALLLAPAAARADFVVVGPGQVPVGAGDEAFNLIAVDLNAPSTLGPGAYQASQFNYQFTDFAGFQTPGSITPVLLTGGGTTFTPVAVGDAVTFSGATGFLSTTFGGSDTFTLGASTTVYAGLYWQASYNGGPELRMPV